LIYPAPGATMGDMNTSKSGGGEPGAPGNLRVPGDMIPDIRVNHAGESGAVSIYRSILRYCRAEEVRDFARRHLDSEEKHLAGFGALLGPRQKSLLVPFWKLAGRAQVALLSLFGPRAIYAAVQAVEDGVVRHFQKQLDRLEGRDDFAPLAELLREYQADERRHRDEAAEKMGPPGPGSALIRLKIRISSACAVAVTRLV